VNLLSMHTAGPGAPSRTYVRLAATDNVVVLTRRVEPGDAFAGPDGEQWTMSTQLDVGNKLAAAAIVAGERIIKVGVPIGTATRAIEAGAHVHTHNVRSDHIPIDVKGGPRVSAGTD
jgi:altronate dehydratase small subunit